MGSDIKLTVDEETVFEDKNCSELVDFLAKMLEKYSSEILDG